MRGRRRIPEVIGSQPWPTGFRRALPPRTGRPVKIVVTPLALALRTVADLDSPRDVIIYSTEPSAVEAALLIAAGANAYVTTPRELRHAVAALERGDTWFSPVAATAVCRLARITRSQDLDAFAVAARAAAAGRSWPGACRAVGLAETGSHLHRLRQRL